MKKSFLATELLCLFFGWLGVHRYYTGYKGIGILQTLTLGGLGIWAFVDFLSISLGKYKDAQGRELEDYNKNIGVGALILLLFLGLICNFGPKSKSKTISTNNFSTNNFEVTYELPKEENAKEVVFSNAKCSISATGYSCFGNLTEEEKQELKEMIAELKN